MLLPSCCGINRSFCDVLKILKKTKIQKVKFKALKSLKNTQIFILGLKKI